MKESSQELLMNEVLKDERLPYCEMRQCDENV